MGTNAKRRTTQIKEIIILLVSFFIIAAGIVSYIYWKSLPPTASAVFISPDGTKQSKLFALEIANTDATRALGLMFRKPDQMAKDEGMIFSFPKETVQRFWMKNTFISLDMLFVDKDFKVVGVLENVPILNEEPRTVDVPSKYVIELNAGAAKENNIVVGSSVRVKGLSEASD